MWFLDEAPAQGIGCEQYSYIMLITLIVMLAVMFIQKRAQYDKGRLSKLNRKDFLDTMRKGTLIDVRKPEQFKEDKILGAKNYPGKSGTREGSIRKDIPIFIYDQDGKRAASVGKEFVRNGATMVYILKGGFNVYKNPELEVIKENKKGSKKN